MKSPRRKNIIYVTTDIERALGMTPQSHYRIVTNDSSYARTIKESYPDFITILGDINNPLDTPSLLKQPELHALALNLDAGIVVFKNNQLIESIANEKGLKLLNPHALLAEKIENKVSQVEWLGELAHKYLPEYKVKTGKELIWNDTPYVFQWAHGHSGESTFLIRSQKEAENIRKTFPERTGRVTAYVNGPSFTVNAVVTPEKTLMGNISYQITGIQPFTDQPFSTIGNDWSIGNDLLSEREIFYIEAMVGEIGDAMRKEGWKGLFGIDFMRDNELNTIFLIEINARQPAGVVFESHLEQEMRIQGIHGQTVFEAHIHSLSGEEMSLPLIPINDGAQILQRLTSIYKPISLDKIKELKNSGFNIITYENKIPNSNMLRIQSNKGIMENHGKFNSRGKKILDILT